MRFLEFFMFAVVPALVVLVLVHDWPGASLAKRGAVLVNGAPSIVEGTRLVGGAS